MINYDLSKIRAIVFDVDGVLSAETIVLSASGEPLRTVNIKDGYAIQLAVKRGLQDVMMGCKVKTEAYDKLVAKYGLADDEVLYMGDDIPDYEVMKRVGCPCCPADACPEIRDISLYVSHRNGGYGCGRDVVEQVLMAQGKWMSDKTAFGW